MKCFYCDLPLTVFIVIVVIAGMNLGSQVSKAAGNSPGSSDRSGSTKSDRESGGSRDPHAEASNGEATLESLIEEGINKGMKIDELQRRTRYGGRLPGHQPPGWEEKLEGLLREQTWDRAPMEIVRPKTGSRREDSGDELKLSADVKAAMQKAAAYQRAAAKRLGKPVEITNSLGMKLKLIPAGKFMMGAPDWDKKAQDNEQPEHLVRITKPYYLGVTEVTQSQWNAAMDSQPWKGDIYVKEGADYPAAGIKWKDAVEFCEKLSKKEHMTYRLPTEAEWEYACRAGTNTVYCFGNDASQLTRYAWWGISLFLGVDPTVDPCHPNEPYPHRVAQKMPNAFGLYDMHGNVWEWCQDRYDSNYYACSPTDDPKGPRTGSSRVFRGGAWIHGAESCRSANRSLPSPRVSYSWFGFRVAGRVVDVQAE